MLKKSLSAAILVLSSSVQAEILAYLPVFGTEAHKQFAACLEHEVQRQMPSSIGSIRPVTNFHGINEKDPSIANIFMGSEHEDKKREGYFLEIKTINGSSWSLEQVNSAITAYAEAAVFDAAALVDWKSFEQKGTIDISPCKPLMVSSARF